jgi:hypothetical protein
VVVRRHHHDARQLPAPPVTPSQLERHALVGEPEDEPKADEHDGVKGAGQTGECGQFRRHSSSEAQSTVPTR